jgi:hypothetical protein
VGNDFAYAYDRVGNRETVSVNGVPTTNHTFNAANQVSGWSYDAAGNLLGYGAGDVYAYDALASASPATRWYCWEPMVVVYEEQDV